MTVSSDHILLNKINPVYPSKSSNPRYKGKLVYTCVGHNQDGDPVRLVGQTGCQNVFIVELIYRAIQNDCEIVLTGIEYCTGQTYKDKKYRCIDADCFTEKYITKHQYPGDWDLIVYKDGNEISLEKASGINQGETTFKELFE